MDIMVAATQDWLWAHYGQKSWFWRDCPKPNTLNYGKTGWHTVYTLLRVFQYIVGIPDGSITNNFGAGTTAKYEAYGLMKKTTFVKHDPLHQVMQGALWCKGYSTGKYLNQNEDYLDDTFDADVEFAVKVMQEHAGVAQTGVVSVNLMKALLSMDYFKMPSYENSGADEKVREFQQFMNGRYESYIGIGSCDGFYGRETNKSLIFAIQAEEKLPVGVANGAFGNTTQRCLPTLPYLNKEFSYNGTIYSSADIAAFTKIMNFGLYVNGFGQGATVTLNQTTIREFQTHYKLPITGVCDKVTWMSLAISKGDVTRSAVACDTVTRLNQTKITTLKNLGYNTVGRYLTNFPNGLDKKMTREELELIIENEMKYFCIFQESLASGSLTASWFTVERAQYDASRALEAANVLGIPENAIIYFAVDFDALGYEIDNQIKTYFQELNRVFAESELQYRIGVYGPRLLCQKMSQENLAVSSFVADMSTGFSGNLGYKIPDNWAFDQFYEYTIGSAPNAFGIDKVAKSGMYDGENTLQTRLGDSRYVTVYIQAHSSTYYNGRSADISEITIHHTAGVMTVEAVGALWASGIRKASSHYAVEGNNVGQFVRESDGSGCNGTSDAGVASNQRAVTIETCNSTNGEVVPGEKEVDNPLNWQVSDESLETLIKLVADIAKRNNLGKLKLYDQENWEVDGEPTQARITTDLNAPNCNLTWHSMYNNTQCPGPYLRRKLLYVRDEANRINGF